ncbi:hypothetical protein ACQEU5_08350 [Marinactinospora thermotolerans]|uniref:hypothetical protein n=1 Tax=Marinactinospora thermotolerans TaxID=531310 RepID=UPI001184C47D|nr:hypothetical protein [Marinactinospora thermotolerans]
MTPQGGPLSAQGSVPLEGVLRGGRDAFEIVVTVEQGPWSPAFAATSRATAPALRFRPRADGWAVP